MKPNDLVEEFAAIWYAHDAGVSLEQARKSVAEDRDAEHGGDCRKEPWTCMRCTVDEAFKAGREMLDAINALGMWVAPWEATWAMMGAMRDHAPEVEVPIGTVFEVARDAHLAEQGEKE